MANDIFRVGKVSSIDYAAGLVRVAYPDKDNSVTAPLPMLCTEYNMPQVGDPGLFRKDLARTPGEAMIRYDGTTLTIKCNGAISIEAGGAVTINGSTIDLN